MASLPVHTKCHRSLISVCERERERERGSTQASAKNSSYISSFDFLSHAFQMLPFICDLSQIHNAPTLSFISINILPHACTTPPLIYDIFSSLIYLFLGAGSAAGSSCTEENLTGRSTRRRKRPEDFRGDGLLIDLNLLPEENRLEL